LKSYADVLNRLPGTTRLGVLAARHIKPAIRFHLKIRQLMLLVRLDEERSLVRAAAKAGLTQPAASKLLRQIESALDVKLFDRHARGMTPTCYGEILVRHAQLALSELGLAREEIVALKSGLSGRAAIGTVLNPGINLVPMAVARIKQRYPGIVASIEIGPSRDLVQKLLRGDLDMVVGRVYDSSRTDDLRYEPLAADEQHAVIAGAQHPLAGRKNLQLEHLVEQPWILPPAGSLVRDKLTGMFVQHGLPMPTNIVETQCLPVITTLLRQSDMVVVLPEEACQSCCQEGVLTVLVGNLPLGVGAFGLITRRHHKLSPGAQLMLSTLREQAGQLRPVASRGAALSLALRPALSQ
jgi:DNA-binding transcriptional LysR family regulator